MGLAIQRAPYNVDDDLALEERAGVKQEYVEGAIHAMSGASERHNRIALNAAFHFRSAPRGGPAASTSPT